MKLMKRKAYPTDLTDKQWQILEPLLPKPAPRGAPRRVDLREIVNALLYVNRTGCQWRMLPHDFPDWQVVYDYFRDWRDQGTFKMLNDQLRIQIRVDMGRNPEPSAAILDSQTVKGTEMSDVRGFDMGKKTNGIKRHALVDTNGLLLALMILPANIQDPAGARLLLGGLREVFARLTKIWADGIYGGTLIDWVKEICGWTLEIIKRTDAITGFVPLPRRWVIERFFGWLNWSRRLSKHYERRTDSGEVMVYLSTLHLMLKRKAGSPVRFACRMA
jgi:putative transposase